MLRKWVILMARARMKKKNKYAYRLLLFGTSSFLIIGTLAFTVGNYWAQIFSKYKEKKNLENELVELKKTEEALKVDVEKLQDPDYVARYAREKYYYSRDGEFIIRLP